MTVTATDIGYEVDKHAAGLASDAEQLAKKAVGEQPLIDRARAAIEDAVDLTVTAIRENPVAAAAIVGGVAATVAGAAFGVSKLREGNATTTFN